MYYNPTASIIIPVYNGEKFLTRCLTSVFRQTYSSIEIIIINDGSNDRTEEIVKKKCQKHLRNISIKYISQSNAGVAAARNKGIEIAEGEYITFVDQDDYIADDYVEAYMLEIQARKLDILVGGYKRVDDNTVIRQVVLDNTKWAPFIVVAPWAHFYKRDFLIENEVRFLKSSIGEDVYFSLIAYSHTPNIGVINNTGYYWYDNQKSVSNSKQKVVSNAIDPLFLLNRIHDDFPQSNYISRDFIEYYFVRYVVWYELFTLRNSSRNEARKMAEKLDSWLRSNYPNYLTNRYIKQAPKGELKSAALATRILVALEKAGIKRIIFLFSLNK